MDRQSKAPSILATMSKQHCRTLQVERFFRQCRTLLRHCCWCGRGLCSTLHVLSTLLHSTTTTYTQQICINLRKTLWQKWGGHVHPSSPRGDAPGSAPIPRPFRILHPQSRRSRGFPVIYSTMFHAFLFLHFYF